MSELDYQDSHYERLKQQAPEPSADEIRMSLDAYRRKSSVATQPRFPQEPSPVVAEPQTGSAEPVDPAPQQRSAQDDHHDEAEFDREEAGEVSDDDIAMDGHHLGPDQEQRTPDQDELEDSARYEHSVGITSGSTANTATTSAAGGAAAATAPQARPQRDDPDDGEHSDSHPTPDPEPVEQQLESNSAVEPAAEPVTPEPLTDTQPVPAEESAAGAAEGDSTPEKERSWTSASGSHPVDFDERVSFKHGEKVTVLKRIPRSMTEHLRLKLSAVTGGDFAAKISAQSLVTAFISVKLGYDIEVDSNTRQAIRAFAMMEPRLDAIEEHSAEISKDIIKIGDAMTKMDKKLRSITQSTQAMELVESYIFTDRVLGGLEGADDTAESIRLNAPRVTHTRNVLRKEADDVIRIEEEGAGRAYWRGR